MRGPIWTGAPRTVGGALATLALAVLTALALAGAACGGAAATATPALTAIPGPPAFPLIFSGKFTVGGKPGPAGLPIFARIGDARSPLTNTGSGTYNNIILGPSDPASQSGKVEFFLGNLDGITVRASQTYRFQVKSQPTNVTLDLNFSELPDQAGRPGPVALPK